MPTRWRSEVAEPTADVDGLRHDSAGGVRGQVPDHSRYLVGGRVPAQWNLCRELFQDIRLRRTPGSRIPPANPCRHRGLHVAWAHRVDGDPGLCELVPKRFGEADHAVLGRRVGHSQHNALLPGDGSYVDDPSPSLAQHASSGEHLPGHEEHAVEIRVDDVEPQLVVELGGHSTATSTGIVDEDVHRSEALDGRADERPDLLARPDVTRCPVDVTVHLAQLLDGEGDVVRVTRAYVDAGVLACEQLGDREPDATRRAGDDCSHACSVAVCRLAVSGCHLSSCVDGRATKATRTACTTPAKHPPAAAR